MITDALNTFADSVSVAAAAGTAQIGESIDLGAAHRDIGMSAYQGLYLVVTVSTEIITGGAAGTIKFILASDAQTAIATDGSATVHYDSGTFVTDDSAANSAVLNAGGRPVCVALPLEGNTYERFLGVLATIGTTTVTAGAVNAFLTKTPPAWAAYPDGI
jgi:hypothetical protein